MKKMIMPLAVLIGAAFVVGCGAEDVGSAPVVRVSASQREKDVNEKAESTLKWLESMAPSERQAALSRAPQIAASLKETTDPGIKSRLASLGLNL